MHRLIVQPSNWFPHREPASQRTSVLHRSVANLNHAGILYLDLVGHTLPGEFRSYREQNGGRPVFGYPLSEEFGERNADLAADFTTQYFEREPFESHPEHPAPYRVLLGRLGAEILQQQGRSWRDEDDGANPFPGMACDVFMIDTERRSVCGPLLSYWRSHGLEFDGRPGTSYAESLALLGLIRMTTGC